MKSIVRELFCPAAAAGPLGLKAFHLRDLPPIVALAGPNGSGKTRLLRLFKDIVSQNGVIITGLRMTTPSHRHLLPPQDEREDKLRRQEAFAAIYATNHLSNLRHRHA